MSNNNVSLITNSLEYYDKNNEKYHNIIKPIKYVKFIPSESDLKYSTIILYDKNKNELFRSKYEIIGLFNSNTNIWTWSWSITRFRKNDTHIARKIWNYGAELDPETEFLKMELTTSRFRIADLIQLDMHIALASYLSKQPFVYKHYLYLNSRDYTKDNDLYNIEEKSDSYVIYYLFLLDNKLEEHKDSSNEEDINSIINESNQTESITEDD